MPPPESVRSSVRHRIEAFLLRNLGVVVSAEQIKDAAKDPKTGVVPENWHQRLSELRVNFGYTILTNRDRPELRPGQYLMPTADKRPIAVKRIVPTRKTWETVLSRAKNKCEWSEGGHVCSLKEGDIDPIGGGTVRLTADHVIPHSIVPHTDPNDPTKWRALCGRHQVIKKNFWDSESGKLNVVAILQAAPSKEKEKAYAFLQEFFAKREAPGQ